MPPSDRTRVVAQRDVQRDAVEVYIVTPAGDFITPDAIITPGPDAPGPPFLTVPGRWADEIGKALSPQPEATSRHLDDAIAIRDRLLVLIEREVSDG